MNILITAPNLNPTKNVSGIATVVQSIIDNNNQHAYYHYILGRLDGNLSKFNWFIQLLKQILCFPLYLKKKKIELVHQNLPFDPKGLLRESVINIWCRIFKVPVVLHVHGGIFLMNPPKNKFYRFLAKQLFKYSKTVVMLSALEKEAIAKYYNENNTLVLMNSIDTSKFSSSHRTVYGDKPSLLFMGRIHESKGIVDIVSALKILKKETDFRFILCGNGPLREYCINECKQILGNDFEYKGVVFGCEKLNIIKNSDYFILPSYFEGLPISLLESMSAGLVPIVTNVGSISTVVQNSINGVIVEKHNPQDLYKKLIRIIPNKALFQQLSCNAMTTISAEYDIKSYVSKLNKIYSEVLRKTQDDTDKKTPFIKKTK